MTREDIYNDINETLGSVPGFIAKLDDDHIGPIWEQTKKTFLSDMSCGIQVNALAALSAAYALECEY